MNVYLVCSVVILFAMQHQPSGNEQKDVFAQISEAHARLESDIFSDLSVDIMWETITLPEEIKISKEASLSFGNGSKIIQLGEDLMASNPDYRFRLKSPDKKPEISYLEGKSEPNPNAEKREELLAAMAKMSIYFDDSKLSDVLADRQFAGKLISVDDGKVVITGKWESTKGQFLISSLVLDPKNHYQITSCEYELVRPNSRLDVSVKCKYDSVEDLDGLLMPSEYSQELRDPEQSGEPNQLWGRVQTTYFSNWTRGPSEKAIFRLSNYGFDEPDLDALNGRRSRLGLFVSAVLGAIGIVMFLLGKRQQAGKTK